MHGWSRWGSVSRGSLRHIQSESMLWFIKMLNIRRKAPVNIKEAASRSLSDLTLRVNDKRNSPPDICLYVWFWMNKQIWNQRDFGSIKRSISCFSVSLLPAWKAGPGVSRNLCLIRGRVNPSCSRSVCHERNKWRDGSRRMFYHNYSDKIRPVPAGALLHVWSRIMFPWVILITKTQNV